MPCVVLTNNLEPAIAEIEKPLNIQISVGMSHFDRNVAWRGGGREAGDANAVVAFDVDLHVIGDAEFIDDP